ncbi:hypothetical protein YC2023_053622 [Brassica napus]
MPSRHNPIKQLITSTKLHNQMHSMLILISLLQSNNVGMLRHMPHDLDFSPNILYIYSLYFCEILRPIGSVSTISLRDFIFPPPLLPWWRP